VDVIDVHCHILPALDDGAPDLDESLAMAHQAIEDGIEVVCATPHLRADHAVDPAELAARVSALQGELDSRGMALRIATGGEVSATLADELDDEALRLASLGGGGWLLLEPAPGPMDDTLHELVDRLHARGFDVVLAHPERHAGEDFVARLRAFAAAGVLIQWTGAFVADAQPDDLVLALARAGLVELLGSDSHSARIGRPVALRAAYDRLRGVCGEERAAWIERDAPAAVLRGERPPTAPV
jgi:protein-tyrosine phosphatase